MVMIRDFCRFSRIYAIDFEYYVRQLGDIVVPVCVVILELLSGQYTRLWLDSQVVSRFPLPMGRDTLFIAYNCVAEISCFLALNWEVPAYWLDLYVEFRWKTNGKGPQFGNGLLGALLYHHLDGISAAEKKTMIDLVLTGGPWSDQEKADILAYCQSDVDALRDLLPAMKNDIDLPRALFRAEYMVCCARMEHLGIPVDVEKFQTLRRYWDRLQLALIKEINWDYDRIYKGTRFRRRFFEWWLAKHRIPWPRTASGVLDTRLETFEAISARYPQVIPLMKLRDTLGQMRLNRLAVGRDGRARCSLRPFAARTSRNAPSTRGFLFAMPAWMRGAIASPFGYGICYLDYEQAEFGAGAALSGDPLMMAAYQAGDAYTEFAIQAGAIPVGGTKHSHPRERGIYKELAIAIQYGLGVDGIAKRTGTSTLEAKLLLRQHKRIYRHFWRWSDSVVNYGSAFGRLWTVFGWQRYYSNVEPQSMRNFPIQSNSAEILRLAVVLGFQAGVQILAPVHDALLVQYPIEERDDAIAAMTRAMIQASEIVLNGFPLRVEVTTFEHPSRFMEDRGRPMWDLMWQLVERLEAEEDDGLRPFPY
jgi:DNA polymerase-1